MSEKRSFILYHDDWDLIEDLSIKERGELITAIYQYELNKTEPNFTGALKTVFKAIRKNLDRNAEKYQERCDKNRENANKRWDKQKEDSNNNCPF